MNSSAKGQELSPQAILNIDLNAIPAQFQLSVVGALADDKLSGNGVPGTFTNLPRAHAIAVGDFNRDGIQDLAIGAPEADVTPTGGTVRANGGAVYIIFGRANISNPSLIDTLTNQPNIRIIGGAADDNVGFALAAGDVNGDGGDDLLIGAPGVSALGTETPPVPRADTGAVFVLLGANTLSNATIDLGVANALNIAIFGERPNDRFGSAIAVGNVGGASTTPDILIGAPFYDGPANDRTDAGAAYLIFGGPGLTPTGTTTRVIDVLATPASSRIVGNAGSLLGSAVAIGDVNAGGAPDIVVGAPLDSRVGVAQAGAVYVVFGGDNLNPTPPATVKNFDIVLNQQSAAILGDDANDRLGAAVAVGNIAGDATADIAIGAPTADGPSDTRQDSGEVYVITGSSTLPVTTTIGVNAVALTIFGAATNDHFGSTVVIGRVNTVGNTDLLPDLLVGAPGFDFGARGNAGAVSVFFGGASLLQFPARDMLLGQDDVRVVGQAVDDELGWAIAAGDIDNNTGGDLIVGAPFNDPVVAAQRLNAGRVYVLLAGADVIPPVNQAPTVTVVTPNGGETVAGGSSFNITWTANDPNGENTIQRFEIRLSTDGGATFNFVIATNVPNAPGPAETFTWNVPIGINTTQARIRVIAFDNTGLSGQDDSNANFTISDVGVTVMLTAPNGGENLRFGQAFNITWTVPEAVAAQIAGFDLFLSTDGGNTFPIAITPINPTGPALPGTARTFAWTVPAICTTQARVLVRATNLNGTQSFDASNANFTISAPGPTVDLTDMDFNNSLSKLTLKTDPPVGGGAEVTFAQNATVEISTDAAGTTFVSVPNVGVNNSGTKLKARGTINGQNIGAFFPEGQVRFLRITNPPCGVTLLRVTRQGGVLVIAPAAQAQEVWN